LSRRGWVLFTAMSLIWGVPYLLIKVVDDAGVPVPVLVLTRVAGGAVILLPIALRRGELGVLRPHWRWLAIFACVEIILPWLFLSQAERRLSSSMSGLLIASVPIIGVVLARLTGGTERLTPLRWAGLLGGLAGVALLAGPGALGGDLGSVVLVLLTAVGYATGPLIASRKLAGLPGLGMTAVCLGFAAVVYAPAAALTWPSTVPSAKVLASLAGLAVICTALAFVLFFQLIAEVGPARATVITYVNPAVAVALGVGVLGEPLTPEIIAAFGLILAGSVLATQSGRPAAQPGETATRHGETGARHGETADRPGDRRPDARLPAGPAAPGEADEPGASSPAAARP
jgi:drug/metabolite transporter (DMT)-like permease